MRTIAGIKLTALLFLAACDTSTHPDPGETGAGNMSIAHLKSLCKSTTTPLTQDLTICGTVTANDIRGEFVRTLIIEDATGGIGIAADHTALADVFPLGAAVTVRCNGLALGDYGGKVQLGATPTGNYSVDRIARAEIERYIRCTELNNSLRRPRTMLPAEVTMADADTYIRFESVRFAEQDTTWCDRDPENGQTVTTLRTVIDQTGIPFLVRIPATAHYANEPIPHGTGSINGIVDYFNAELSLRIINFEVDFTTSAKRPTAYPSALGCSIPTPTK